MIQSDPKFKAAFIRSLMRFIYSKRSGEIQDPLTICKETFLYVPVVMYTKKNFYLLDALNDRLEMLKQSGLIEFWRSNAYDTTIFKSMETGHPKVITFDHLMSGLQILFVGYGLSFITFVIEIKCHSLVGE